MSESVICRSFRAVPVRSGMFIVDELADGVSDRLIASRRAVLVDQDSTRGASVIHLVHNAADKDGNTLEVSESVWPADRIFVIDDYDIAQDPEDAEGLSDV
jgi:hypothetical protein